MDRKIYVGNASDLAQAPDKIYIGDSNDVARLAKKIYVGDSNGRARQVWPPFKWVDVYQRCEYILNNSATQYIITGVKPTNYTRFIVDFKIENTLSYDSYIFNVMQGYYNQVSILGNTSTNQLKLYFNGRGPGSYDAPVATKTYSSQSALMDRHVVDYNRTGGYFFIDDAQVGSSQATFSQYSNSVPLFGEYNGVNGKYSAMPLKFRLYSFKAYENGVLIRDMVPCYRRSDTEIGLYDFVNDVFYTNSGSGIFYKGPDV